MLGTMKTPSRSSLSPLSPHNLRAVTSASSDINTLSDRLLMLLIRLLMIWPLKLSALLTYAYWTWRVRRRSGWPSPAKRARYHIAIFGYLLRLGIDHTLSFWLSLETLFFFFYFFKHRRLQDQAAKPAQMNIYTQPGAALDVLQRIFKATNDIQSAGKLVDPGSPSIFTRGVSPTSSAQDLQALLHPQVNESSMEQLLRDWDEFQLSEASMTHRDAPSSPKRTLKHSLSKAEIELVDNAEMLALKRAEVSGWFLHRHAQTRWPAALLHQICLGNLAEFNAWVFFHSTPDQVPADRRDEFEQVISSISTWVEVRFPPGYNPDVQSMRLTMDGIKSEYRPLAYYAVTAFMLPTLTDQAFAWLGFRRYKSGTLKYWCRPATTGLLAGGKMQDGRRLSNGEVISTMSPFVICHGIGIDAVQYFPLIRKTLEIGSDRAIFIVSMPHITMQLKEDVPSSAEMVPCISDMLASWGYCSAHFIGHSFGSVLIAWVIRRNPDLVSMATFIDPVCFLLIKPDVCYNFVYRRPRTPTQLFMSYFGARELYIAHSLSRNFFWSENILWPEQLCMPALIVLSGKDSIVPAHSVRRYLQAYQKHRKNDTMKVLWFPHLGHGEINLDKAGHEALDEIAKAILGMETAQKLRQRLG